MRTLACPSYRRNDGFQHDRDGCGRRSRVPDRPPGEARYRDSAATAVVEDGLRVRVDGPDGASVTTDMVSAVGGGGSAPSPAWLFRAGYASCVATLISIAAAVEGVELTGLRGHGRQRVRRSRDPRHRRIGAGRAVEPARRRAGRVRERRRGAGAGDRRVGSFALPGRRPRRRRRCPWRRHGRDRLTAEQTAEPGLAGPCSIPAR